MVGGRHTLLRWAADVWAATTNFVLGTVAGQPFAPMVARAMAASGAGALRLPLTVGFGRYQ